MRNVDSNKFAEDISNRFSSLANTNDLKVKMKSKKLDSVDSLKIGIAFAPVEKMSSLMAVCWEQLVNSSELVSGRVRGSVGRTRMAR